MSLLIRRCLSRSHLLEEYVETWQIDHKEAMYARDLEELVKECLELAPLLRRAWQVTLERLFDERERSDRVLAGEEIVKGAIQRTVRILKFVTKLIEGADRAGYSIDGADDFRDAACDMEMLEKEAETQWPPLDSQQMRESIAAFERGEFESTEDMLRELRGQSTQTD